MQGYGCDAVILTAAEVETQLIHGVFDGFQKLKMPGDQQVYFKTAIEDHEGHEIRIISAQQEVLGMTAASMLATKTAFLFRPKYLMMCGIAGGIGDQAKQCQGDVIVPDVVWDYTTGKYVGVDETEIRFGDIGFLPRPVSIKTDKEILRLVRESVERKDMEYHVHIGPLACGNCVVANEEIVNIQIKPLFSHTIGLDMESYSVYYAAQNALDPKPKPIVIKSICDFANSEKDDKFQKFAAYNSAQYARYLLENILP